MRGAVQGVGFRPFVKREADARGLKGWVRNTGRGVEVVAVGDLSGFEEALREGPPLARVESIESAKREGDRGEVSEGFEILESGEAGGIGVVPPDAATCGDCLDDLRSEGRFGGYWGVSCVDCGPRFTVLEEPPFDRENTSMSEYPLCGDCLDDYRDAGSRRFHSQAFSCPDCGPTLRFEPGGGDPLVGARDLLDGGGVLAVKGVGGFHLACRARDPDAVAELRRRLGRPAKPFAVMVPPDGLDVFGPSEAELGLLESRARPVVLLEGRGVVTEEVAPGLRSVGVMLPYTGLHHLLVEEPLVMTSGNPPGRPVTTENEEAREVLRDVADGFLLHGREIVNRCDDSVARVSGGSQLFLRKSRGRVPLPVEGDFGEVIAVGAERGNVLAVSDRERCYQGQHLGDVDDPGTLEFAERSLDSLESLTGVEPSGVACDLHPGFLTTAWAEELAEERGLELHGVQHHVAHVASVMAEHCLERVVGVAADGYGYGPGGEVWGGEVLLVERGGFERLGGLDYFPLPGGDAAARRPGRVVAGLLSGEPDAGDLLEELGLGGREYDVALRQARRGVNSPGCSSAGRFLDAVSAALGVCRERRYDGEPAMRLEAAAWDSEAPEVEVPMVESGGESRVDSSGLFLRLLELRAEGRSVGEVAAAAQVALARGLAEGALEAGLPVALSGGVAYSDAFHSGVRDAVESGGRSFFVNEEVPPGDGGVCVGQSFFVG